MATRLASLPHLHPDGQLPRPPGFRGRLQPHKSYICSWAPRGCRDVSSGRPNGLRQLLSEHGVQHGVRHVTHRGARPLLGRGLKQPLELRQDVGGLKRS